jgi:hypothetical protein
MLLLLLLACRDAVPIALSPPTPARPPEPEGAFAWQTLLPGLEFADQVLPVRSPIGDSHLRALRIDPGRWTLALEMISARGGAARTTEEWLDAVGGVAAINPAMYASDYVSGVGWMSRGDHVNSRVWAKEQNSLLALDPVGPGQPAFKIFNLGCEAREQAEKLYATRVQSIRMLGCAGENVWTDQPKAWSAALVGEDGAGRALFLHVRSPYRMHDLVDMLRALPLDLRALHYGEGGPEATLSVRTPALTRTWVGSYETAFNENDDLATAWPLPNVLVVVPPTAAP